MKNRFAGLAFAMAISAATAVHAGETDPDRSITVFKTPWCGCCADWVDYMKAAGFAVETEEMEDLTLVRKQAGVGDALAACHTAVIGGARKYVLEGHVPLEAVEKLMSERPDLRGIAVSGMPQGSPGMSDDPKARYTVHAFTGRSGETPSVFMEMGR